MLLEKAVLTKNVKVDVEDVNSGDQFEPINPENYRDH